MSDTSKISDLIIAIKSAGLFKRIFKWKTVIKAADLANAELGELKNENLAAYQKETALNDKIKELESENRNISQNLSLSRDQITAAAESSKHLSEKYVTAVTELDKITAEHKQTTEKLIEANTEKEKLKLQKDAFEERTKELEEKNQTLAHDLAEFREQLTASVENSKNLYEKYSTSQTELEKITAEHKQTTEKLIEANTEKEKLKLQKDAFEEKTKELEEKNQTLAQDIAKSREELAATVENSKNLFEKYSTSQAELEKITAEHKQINEEFLKITGERKLEIAGLEELKNENSILANELGEAKKQIAAEESVRDERAKTYERNVENLNVLIEQLESDRKAVAEKLENEFREHQKELEESWKTHESTVCETIKNICKKHDFVFCEKNEYPHRGIPDNAVLIGGLYTIFDAKSPKNPEELDNFPLYLKQQAELMSKYCKFDDVRKEVFLVVPQSTVNTLTTYCYSLAEYNVYVISPESILPIMQILKLIEGYEFAEQLSPEDKDKLCRFIGKLSHTTKRKVQIDTYFAKEIISALHETDSLPEEFAEAIYGYEQKAKLNPPMEKRAKTIYVSDIESDVNRVEKEIIGWSVIN